MATTRYRLPEALGGGECRVLNPPSGNGVYVRVTLGEGDEAFTIDIDRNLLTEIREPLPEEPPFGAVVMVDGEACQHFDTPYEEELVWAIVGSPKRISWVQLCDLALPGEPTRLIPDPFAEPVELPWKNGHGVEVSQTRTDTGMSDQVYVSTKYASYGFAHVGPDVARDMARALWAAADAAEKEQS
jgi:hypothetical protein